MSRPRILDLFCGAGGSAVGYARAGFEVVGVDIAGQPNYPFEFWEMDARDALACGSHELGFSAIAASPPCQSFTAYRRKGHGVGDGYEDLVATTRGLLDATGLPWVIENVEGAPLVNPITLCGSSFGLDVRRHRLFESSFPMLAPPCDHASQHGEYPSATNRTNPRKTCEVGVWRIPLQTQKQAMGVDWDCTLPELSNMVPPAYTEFIGAALLASCIPLPEEARNE
jgi:DNA (cytosine-5)-methyltransferase 1